MAIHITMGTGDDLGSIKIDKEGLRRLIRLGLTGSTKYNLKTRMAARAGRIAMGHFGGIDFPVEIKFLGFNSSYASYIKKVLSDNERKEVAAFLAEALNNHSTARSELLQTDAFDKKTKQLISNGTVSGHLLEWVKAAILGLRTPSHPFADISDSPMRQFT